MADLSNAQKKEELIKILNSEERFFSGEELYERTKFLEIEKILFISYRYNSQIEFDSIRIYNIITNTYGNRVQSELRTTLFCSRSFYDNLIEDLVEDILMDINKSVPLKKIEEAIHQRLGIFLGLDELSIATIYVEKISDILSKASHRFVIFSLSAYEKIEDKLVFLKNWEQNKIKPKEMLLNAMKLIKQNGSITLKRLLFKMNMIDKDFGYSKPYTIETISKILDMGEGFFNLNADTVTLKPIKERIIIGVQNKSSLRNFNETEDMPGLLIFFFVGRDFFIEDARNYINIRDAVYFYPIKNVKNWEKEIFQEDNSEFCKTLASYGVQDQYEWALDNLSVSFILEEFESLKVDFTSLMQEYSPVLNLDKNPGNLFRSIIEEKIREYESGKES